MTIKDKYIYIYIYINNKYASTWIELMLCITNWLTINYIH